MGWARCFTICTKKGETPQESISYILRQLQKYANGVEWRRRGQKRGRSSRARSVARTNLWRPECVPLSTERAAPHSTTDKTRLLPDRERVSISGRSVTRFTLRAYYGRISLCSGERATARASWPQRRRRTTQVDDSLAVRERAARRLKSLASPRRALAAFSFPRCACARRRSISYKICTVLLLL
jgi:hypothetical protein